MVSLPSSKRLRLDSSAYARSSSSDLEADPPHGSAVTSCSPSEGSEAHTPPIQAANHPFASTGGIPQAPRAPSRKGRRLINECREISPLASGFSLKDVQMSESVTASLSLCASANKRTRAMLRRGLDEEEDAPHVNNRQLRTAQRLSSRLAALNDPAISGPPSTGSHPALGLKVSPMPLDEGFALQPSFNETLARRSPSHQPEKDNNEDAAMSVDEEPSSLATSSRAPPTSTSSGIPMGRSISANGPPRLAGSPVHGQITQMYDGLPLLRIAASRTPLRTRAQLRAAAATASASASASASTSSCQRPSEQGLIREASIASQPLPVRCQSPDPFTCRPRSASSSSSCSSPRPQHRRQRSRNSPASARCTPFGDYFGDWSGNSNSAGGGPIC
ncbi:hypothetical protein IE81DRAFT_146201 [Ceraceosorus guamensis]|uniref:Uncharacterized protein n=1 Tax=Ceraceosorus guamensis TaxID=1522189 RepID=A0A316VX46_9BASI|nr:hypothetical protein IE81DRAFT_146201 [Ceraceosorus guamensis]PWN42050.1 hypothetical protein IE81DRAFT_146201 [Ceraceosorus guamensis]